MSKKQYKQLIKQQINSSVQQNKSIQSYTDYDIQIHKLNLERNNAIQKAFSSNDPDSIIKAQQYLQGIEKRQESGMKSFIFSPEHEFYNSLGYKNTPSNTSYQTLRNMGRTPFIRPIRKTRMDQVSNFAEFVEDEQQVGWAIRKKKKPFQTEADKKLTDQDKKEIESIVNFIENAGTDGNKWNFDTFETFLRKIVDDSLTIDQSCFEIVHNRRGQLIEYIAVDGGTMRLSETYDNREKSWIKHKSQAIEINGYYPSYVQVYNQQTYNEYYPWEMCFGIRNQSTDIMSNGYGVSELEDMIQVVTYLLYGMQYNGNFFKQGSNPKGILNIKNGAGSGNALNEFKQVWRSTVAGVSNSHKTPVVEGVDLEWIDMQSSNKEMEFQQWFDFLQLLACSIFSIDPSELGFNFAKSASMFGQDGQKERLKHSQTKGLIPILKFIQRNINKYLVERLNKNYEFVFCGIEQEDKVVALDMDVKKSSAGFTSMEDMFRKYSGRDYKEGQDTILNQAFIAIQNQKMMGGDVANQQVDEMNDEYDQSDNPFTKALDNWTEKNIIHKGE